VSLDWISSAIERAIGKMSSKYIINMTCSCLNRATGTFINFVNTNGAGPSPKHIETRKFSSPIET